MVSKVILLTGAAGRLGAMLRPMLLQRYGRLIVSDRFEITDLREGEVSRPADLCDADQIRSAVAGVEAIVHLGGHATEAEWSVIVKSNIEGVYNLFDAARIEGVQRIVFASSNHAVGMYPRLLPIGVDSPVRPDSRYGLSKAFGEATAALYADKFGLRCLSIRIGSVADAPADLRRLSNWIHPEDLFQLCVIGLEHPDLHNEVVFGMSDNARTFWNNKVAYRLGYRPRHYSEDHALAALQAEAGRAPDRIGDRLQGGTLAGREFSGDIDRTCWS